MTRSRLRLALLLAALPLFLIGLAACEDDEDGGDPTATTEASGDGTPEAIDISNVPELSDGTLTFGSDIAYAPIEFFEEGTETPAGLDIDLGNAIGEALGVEVEFINTGFDGIIPALNTDDFDAIMSAMTVNEERLAEVDFVEYLSVGTGMVVPEGNPDGVGTAEDLCGLSVAVQLGTIQETLVRAQSDTCDDPITVNTFDTNPLAVEDVRTGGSDVNLSDYPVAYLDAQQSDGDLEVIETQVEPAPYGIALRKDSDELEAVLQQAVDALIASDEYGTILAKWDLESTALN
jgi:polar amino acid transport system substrate-binding protein